MDKSGIIIHPGEILREEFMAPLGMGPTDLARRLGVPRDRVATILAGKRAITVDTAARLEQAFGMSAQTWINLQTAWDMAHLDRSEIDTIERVEAV